MCSTKFLFFEPIRGYASTSLRNKMLLQEDGSVTFLPEFLLPFGLAVPHKRSYSFLSRLLQAGVCSQVLYSVDIAYLYSLLFKSDLMVYPPIRSLLLIFIRISLLVTECYTPSFLELLKEHFKV